MRDYTVVYSTGIPELIKEVNRNLTEGYIPFGNFVVATDPESGQEFYYQPMILEKK